MNIAKVLLLLGCGGAFVFLAACTGGNYWAVNANNSSYGSGLWKSCGSYFGCVSINAYTDWAKAVRAFAIMAVLASIAGGLMALLGLLTDKVKGIFASIFMFGAAGCMIIALAIYTDKSVVTKINGVNFGWSYILGWIGVIGAGVTGVIGIFADK